MLSFFFWFLLLLTSTFMVLIILLQRGRGGGLAGALGGAGGQSAFGAKAGDTFTRITVITAIIWFTLCLLAIRIMNPALRSSAERSGLSSGDVVDVGAEDKAEDASVPGDAGPANGDLPDVPDENKGGESVEPASGDVGKESNPPADGETDKTGKPEVPPGNADGSGR